MVEGNVDVSPAGATNAKTNPYKAGFQLFVEQVLEISNEFINGFKAVVAFCRALYILLDNREG